MIPSRRDSLFPPGSLGRNSPVSRTASHESLSTHPLLSPPPPGSPTSATSVESATSSSPRYVPYTPRQRVAPTSATTGTTMHPSISAPQQQSTSDATSKLQVMNLKAAAQRIGLDSGSVGWAILERLSTETDHGPEWNDIWNALSVSKATLLLPLEPYKPSEVITAEFIKDHIALCDGQAKSNAPIVTLSGLRGTLTDATITFRSVLSPASEQFQKFLSPASRSSALSALPPLPQPLVPHTVVPSSPSSSTSSIPSVSQYPTFTVPSHSHALPLPPRPSAQKPPLPPRPGARVASGPPHAAARLSTSFASLFGRGTPPASPSTTPLPLHPDPTPAPGTTPPSGALSERAVPQEHTLDVPAYTITSRIDRAALGRALTDALTSELRAVLGEAGVPPWAIARVERFAAPLYPFRRVGGAGKDEKGHRTVGGGEPARVSSVREKIKGRSDVEWVANAWGPDERGEELSSRFQEFYAELEDAVSEQLARPQARRRGLHFGRRKTPDDAESLAESLDIACRAPSEKAAILVAVHKIIVDGLSKIPPIGLRSEEDMLDEKTPRASSFGRGVSEEDDDVDDDHDENNITLRDESGANAEDPVPALGAPLSPTIILSPEDKPGHEELLPAPGATTVPASIRIDSSHLSPSGPPSPRSAASLQSSSLQPTVSSRNASPTPVSGDIILPLMIFAVVKANPPRLVSNLLYTQRFRRESASGGEEGYCLINLMAVAEFLENVDLAALGLGESEGTVLSASQLSPIPVGRSVRFPGNEPPSPQIIQASLRGRVEQQVDAITGSANKVISGVVDTSFGVLRSLLPGQNQSQPIVASPTSETTDDASSRPGFGILRRDTGFSIASLAASLPGSRARSATATTNEETGQMMIEVPSRPGSSRSVRIIDDELSASEAESTGDEEDEDEEDDEAEFGHDTRSIRSFESMMSGRTGRAKGKRKPNGRMSLTDRLASMPGLSRLSQNQQADPSKVQNSPPGSRRSSLLLPAGSVPNRFDSPVSSRAPSPIAIRISPPNPRFMNATEDDIKVSEVGELLREYKRLVETVRAMGGFHEE
ncbi:predicted protein [Postia placenta Mad-698-R]|uniref:VPS9 domain-containing protein n=1 Tax=Postia placenta MAD-698-R-SB12 TaxID=670580 RepID=A0A1X6N6F2_9APHY|nr:hypothetical protein POSPLADRAFT_1045211 [Postia placenta MAD-698-R-SB12]EED81888.1 predicted protein [Postia placenta Mad-698-R]OSX64090.1 hypothetical protein POSPLADRAFT_1045211 [Postia placenta MAD-698-R-SB12]